MFVINIMTIIITILFHTITIAFFMIITAYLIVFALTTKIGIYLFHVLERKRAITLEKLRKNVQVELITKVHFVFIIYTKNSVKYIFEVPGVIEI